MTQKQINTVENHHPDRANNPTVTTPIPRKDHQKIHGILPNDTPLSRMVREYDAITKQVVAMKNWQIGFTKDFGESPNIGLRDLEQRKWRLKAHLRLKMVPELSKVEHIEGLGAIGLSTILAYAHPERFPSQRKFLYYCGFTQASRVNKKYNRRIKPALFIMVLKIIQNKDPKYYPLYLKLKTDAATKKPDATKGYINAIAFNRTATFLLKEIYSIWRVEK